MARPRKGAEGYEEATAKFRQALIARFGSPEKVREFYSRIGTRGGKAKTDKPKGFAANPALAIKAGSIGGKRSSRAGVKNGFGKKRLEAEEAL